MDICWLSSCWNSNDLVVAHKRDLKMEGDFVFTLVSLFPGHADVLFGQLTGVLGISIVASLSRLQPR